MGIIYNAARRHFLSLDLDIVSNRLLTTVLSSFIPISEVLSKMIQTKWQQSYGRASNTTNMKLIHDFRNIPKNMIRMGI